MVHLCGSLLFFGSLLWKLWWPGYIYESLVSMDRCVRSWQKYHGECVMWRPWDAMVPKNLKPESSVWFASNKRPSQCTRVTPGYFERIPKGTGSKMGDHDVVEPVLQYLVQLVFLKGKARPQTKIPNRFGEWVKLKEPDAETRQEHAAWIPACQDVS